MNVHTFIPLYNDTRSWIFLLNKDSLWYRLYHFLYGWTSLKFEHCERTTYSTVSTAIVDKDIYIYIHAFILIMLHDFPTQGLNLISTVSFLIQAVTFLIQAVSFLIIFNHGWYRMILDDTTQWTYFRRNMREKIRWRRTLTCVCGVTVTA